MIAMLLRFIAGHFRRHRLEALLCLVGVALGVAVVVAIDAAVAAAVQSFGGAVESLAERSTHSIFADTGGVPDSLFVRLSHQKLPGPIAPMIDRGVLVSPAVVAGERSSSVRAALKMASRTNAESETQGASPPAPPNADEDRCAGGEVVVGGGTFPALAAPVFLPRRPPPPGEARPLWEKREGMNAQFAVADVGASRLSAAFFRVDLASSYVEHRQHSTASPAVPPPGGVPCLGGGGTGGGTSGTARVRSGSAPSTTRRSAQRSSSPRVGAGGVLPSCVCDFVFPAVLKAATNDSAITTDEAPHVHARLRAASPLLARLIGVDVFSERSLRSFTSMQSTLSTADFNRFMTEPNTIVMVDSLARRLHVHTGDDVQLTTSSGRKIAHVIGTFEPTGVARSQLDNLIVADLSTAQELTGTVGFLDRIDTELTSDDQIAAMTKLLPPGFVLRSTRQRAESLQQLVQAYRLNLNALSLMASFVAVFIVYNSMLIGVQQRATSLGILRCLGASRPQLATVYALEAAIYAVVGGTIGVLGGWLLSRLLVGYISTTINDLYAAVRPGRVTLDGAMWVKGLAVAVVSCAIGAAVPMVRASRTPPVNAFRGTGRSQAARGAAGVLLVIGIVMIVGSYGVYRLPGNSPVAGFVIALLVALGFALVCPWATRWAASIVDSVARRLQAIWLQMAAGGVGRSLGITGVAVAATMLAIAMNISVRTMVFSFRGSLADWLGERFAADVFVAPELLVNHKVDATIDPAVRGWVQRQPETLHVDTNRSLDVPVGGKPALLFASDIADILKTLPMKFTEPGGKPFDPSSDVLISEPLAGRTKLTVGGALTLASPTGPHRFHIFGVFYDFGTERGQVMMDQSTYAADWRDDAISSLHVKLKPGLDRTAVADRWAAALRPDYPVVANSFDQIKVEAMTVFDRTFKVTEVLTWLSGGVAFCGLAGSLLALALARQRDYGILAAVGMSSRQTAAWVVSQGLLLAWISAAVAPIAGTLLAYVLAYVIQYRSFGWSIPTHPQPQFWLQNFWIATAAALVAAVHPVLRLRRVSPAASLGVE